MKKIAFFDFDNTIYDGYTYSDFINYVTTHFFKDDKFKKQLIYLQQNTKEYNELVSKLANLIAETITNWSIKDFNKYCQLACPKNKILNWVLPVTKFLKANNFENIIITASFAEMLSDSLKILLIDNVFCSQFNVSNKKYTGTIKHLVNDQEKSKIIKQQILVKDENCFTIAFGDSLGDAPMLDAVDLAFLVRKNSPEIEKLALKKGWHIESQAEKIIKIIKKNI